MSRAEPHAAPSTGFFVPNPFLRLEDISADWPGEEQLRRIRTTLEDSGLLRPRAGRDRTVTQTFIGSEFIDWLGKTGYSSSRQNAVRSRPSPCVSQLSLSSSCDVPTAIRVTKPSLQHATFVERGIFVALGAPESGANNGALLCTTAKSGGVQMLTAFSDSLDVFP